MLHHLQSVARNSSRTFKIMQHLPRSVLLPDLHSHQRRSGKQVVCFRSSFHISPWGKVISFVRGVISRQAKITMLLVDKPNNSAARTSKLSGMSSTIIYNTVFMLLGDPVLPCPSFVSNTDESTCGVYRVVHSPRRFGYTVPILWASVRVRYMTERTVTDNVIHTRP